MKILSLAFMLIGYVLFFSFTTSITSCKKNHTVYDTTIIRVHDTTRINVHDTTIIKDSIYDLKDGLVAYYTFNNGSLNDSSGYGNNISFNNATQTADRFGNPNNAYSFNGTSSYMTIPSSQSLNPDNITLYAIVNVKGFYTGPCGINQILSKGYPYQVVGFYNLSFSDNNPNCATATDISKETFAGGYGDDIPIGTEIAVGDNTPISINQWYYVVFTYNGINAKLYINGQLKGTSKKNISFTDNNFNITVGKHENPNYPFYFNGILDELRIYNRALSPEAIKKLISIKN